MPTTLFRSAVSGMHLAANPRPLKPQAALSSVRCARSLTRCWQVRREHLGEPQDFRTLVAVVLVVVHLTCYCGQKQRRSEFNAESMCSVKEGIPGVCGEVNRVESTVEFGVATLDLFASAFARARCCASKVGRADAASSRKKRCCSAFPCSPPVSAPSSLMT